MKINEVTIEQVKAAHTQIVGDPASNGAAAGSFTSNVLAGYPRLIKHAEILDMLTPGPSAVLIGLATGIQLGLEIAEQAAREESPVAVDQAVS